MKDDLIKIIACLGEEDLRLLYVVAIELRNSQHREEEFEL